MINSSYARRVGASALLLSALALVACSSDEAETVTPVFPTVTVIGMDTDESHLLTELYAEALESNGYRVARRAPVADLAAGYAALNTGAADLFVTYTAELLDFLAEEEPELAEATSTTAAPTTTAAETTTTLEATMTSEDSTGDSTDTTGTDDSTDTSTGDSTDTSTGDSTDTTGTDDSTDTTTTDDSTDTTGTDDSTDTTGIDESTTTSTTISIVGQAAAVSLNLQSMQIGEILPDTLQNGVASNAEKKAVIVCTTAAASAGPLSTLTDVAGAASGLRIAGTADWETGDPFGAAGFEEAYGATFNEFVDVAADKIGEAITPETPETPEVDATSTTVIDESTTSTEPTPVVTDADCAAFASSLDPTIPTAAVAMDDDQNWIRNNGVVPLVNATQYSLISPIVDQVSQSLGTTDLRELLRRIAEGEAPNVVAATYLQSAGIVS